MIRFQTFKTLALPLILSGLLAGCGAADRLSEVGKAPSLSRIEDPTEMRNYRPVSMPMPEAQTSLRQANSLWRPGARQFFKDQRAAQVGDILTVNINLQDSAQVNNSTETTRGNTDTATIPNFLGAEATGGALGRIFNGITASSAVDFGSTQDIKGTGKIQRDETISVKVAAVVTQVLPNGNLVVQGRQEIRVNFEVRELLVTGIVRPEDISSANQINHTQMAEARISYGGRGKLTDVQQARWGQQIYDIIFPW